MSSKYDGRFPEPPYTTPISQVDYDALAAKVATLRAENTTLKARLAGVNAQRVVAEANLARLQDRWDARPATEELEARLAEAERDAARYRWIHDNIDWIDGTGYVLNTLHPDADGCAMFQWGVDAAMADSAAPQPGAAHE